MKLKFVLFYLHPFNEVGLTAKRGLNEFLWSRFLNVPSSDSCAADRSFSFRFYIIEVTSRVKKCLINSLSC